ncbi:MAG: hypothetical protein NTZ51_04215 [Proteobacteria bacterium]|nr:hypothetical protein [Pseudomonadota bacterium]
MKSIVKQIALTLILFLSFTAYGAMSYGSEPTCVDIDPSFGTEGMTNDITITGEGTNFETGKTTVSFGCEGIIINSTTVISKTILTVNITVPCGTAANDCDVTVTTGNELLKCKFFITVLPCIWCETTPVEVDEGTDVTFVATSSCYECAPHFNADSTVAFSCDAISIHNTTVESSTKITLNATVGYVAHDTDCNVLVDENYCGYVHIKNISKLERIIPSAIRASRFFPKMRFITITGLKTLFDSTSEIKFAGPQEDAIRVVFKATPNNTILNALIVVAAGSEPGDYAVTVTTGEEVYTGVTLVIEKEWL